VNANKNAATYRRSSKDRNDVSPAAQQRKLEDLARERGLMTVADFVDVLESASEEEEDRSDWPGWVELTTALQNPRRGWNHLLIYDTSRVARRRHIAAAFKHRAKKLGVTIHFATIPQDLDPIAEVFLESMFHAYDEAHSLMCRQKGLMGMAENVRRGWRAGGRAPMGYRLEHQSTGVIRDGRPVMKSKLALGPDAERIRAYLKGRAVGLPRAKLARDIGLKCNPSSLIGIEWNALTYAGHAVWNVHAEPGKGAKRRPREEWIIQRNTHEALITDVEAEAILTALTNSRVGQAVSKAKAAMSDYLLTGILFTSDGRPWTGKSGVYYKLRRSEQGPGRLVKCELVDQAVLAQVTSDMRSDAFLEKLISMSREAGLMTDPGKPIREQLAKLEREKHRAAELALTVEDGGTFTRIIEERSRQIEALRAELAAIKADSTLSEMIRALTPAKLRELLMELGGPRAALSHMAERVVLEPDLNTFQVHYRAALGLSVVSPWGRQGLAPVFVKALRIA